MIQWHDKRMSGELFERVVAVLLLRVHPKARRIRPASGDGGVDIYVPISDDQIEIFQCKHFGDRIRWEQVTTSLNSLKSGHVHDRKVVRWYLVVPKTLSKTQKKTFDEKTKDYPFDCDWFAEDQLDGLAADYPEVGEYYFGEGKVRLQKLRYDYDQTYKRIDDGVAVDVKEAESRLRELSEALGRNDPHLKYGLSIQPTPVLPPSATTPSLLMSEATFLSGMHFQISTYARYSGADEDAQDRLQFNLSMTESAAKRVDHLMAFGGDPVIIRPEELLGYTPPDASHLAASAMQPQLVQIGTAVDRTSAEMRIHLDNRECSEEFIFTRISKTRGHSGGTTIWESPGKMLHIRLIGDNREGSARMQVRWAKDFGDATLAEVIKDLRLFKFLRDGNVLTLCQTLGPIQGPSLVLENGDMVSQADIALYQALANFQKLTVTQIEIPDHLDPTQLFEVLKTGAILQGDLVAQALTSDAFTMTFPRSMGVAPVTSWSMTEVLACNLELPHQTIELGDPIKILRTFRTLKILGLVDEDTIEDDQEDVVKMLVEASPHRILIDYLADEDLAIDEDNPIPLDTLSPTFEVEQATTFDDLVRLLANPMQGR